jgi:hypothetical protein
MSFFIPLKGTKVSSMRGGIAPVFERERAEVKW